MPTEVKLLPWWLTTLSAGEGDPGNAALGLTATEASDRLGRNGPNRLETRQRHSNVHEYLKRFRNPLVVILLVAGAASAFTGELPNFLIIAAIVLLSVTLDFFQEFRANAAAEKLRHLVSVRATVLRDGIPSDVPVAEVVQGDGVLLSGGDLIPADGRVIEANDFFV